LTSFYVPQQPLRFVGPRGIEPECRSESDAILAKQQALPDQPRQREVHLFDNVRTGFLQNPPARDAFEAVGRRRMLQEVREDVAYAFQRAGLGIIWHGVARGIAGMTPYRKRRTDR